MEIRLEISSCFSQPVGTDSETLQGGAGLILLLRTETIVFFERDQPLIAIRIIHASGSQRSAISILRLIVIRRLCVISGRNVLMSFETETITS